MKSDVMHSRVQDEPLVHRPKASSKTEEAAGLNFEKPRQRIQLNDQILKNLTTEVKETVATHLAFPKTETNPFSVVALWNIRRNRRLSGSYRRKPRIVTGFSY